MIPASRLSAADLCQTIPIQPEYNWVVAVGPSQMASKWCFSAEWQTRFWQSFVLFRDYEVVINERGRRSTTPGGTRKIHFTMEAGSVCDLPDDDSLKFLKVVVDDERRESLMMAVHRRVASNHLHLGHTS